MTKDKNIQSDIQEYGWHCLNVFDPEGINPDFVYSIGFEETYNHPEIMIFGLESSKSHHILSDIANDIKDGVALKTNTKLRNIIGGDYDVIFKEVKTNDFSKFLGTAVDYYDKPFRAWVMFWPDKNNVLPTEKGCLATNQSEALKIVI